MRREHDKVLEDFFFKKKRKKKRKQGHKLGRSNLRLQNCPRWFFFSSFLGPCSDFCVSLRYLNIPLYEGLCPCYFSLYLPRDHRGHCLWIAPSIGGRISVHFSCLRVKIRYAVAIAEAKQQCQEHYMITAAEMFCLLSVIRIFSSGNRSKTKGR